MSGRPVVVMCALHQEVATLRTGLAAAADRLVGGRRVTEGTMAGRPVVVAEAGIGKVNAAVVTTQLVDRYRPEVILFTGVAGGLDPDLHVGDVVIGEVTIQHDAGVIENEVLRIHQAGHVPFFNPSDRLGFRPSWGLLEVVRRAVRDIRLEPLAPSAGGLGRPPRIVFGPILTGDQFVNCEQTRWRLHRELGGIAVEMEGAAVAQAAEGMNVDCLVVRALSDLAGVESTFDFVRFLDEVATNSATVIRAITAAL